MTDAITKDPRVNAIITRAKGMFLKPAAEWEKIESESADIAGLFKNYAVILAAIPALCTFLHYLLFSKEYTIMGVTTGLSFGTKLGFGVMAYISGLLLVVVIAFAAEFISPHFGGKPDRIQCFKLATFSMFANWAAGALALVSPGLHFLVGLYSFYLFYLGAQQLLKVQKDKAAIFTGAVTLASIVVMSLTMIMMN